MKKKFLIITSIMVIFLTAFGFWGYNKYFKPNQEIQQQLDNEFGTDFFDLSDVKNNLENNNLNSPDDPANKTDIPTNTSIPSTSEAKEVTLDEIINKYKPQFNYLQAAALSRLDTLYSTAINEYKQSSKAGTLNRSELAQKYIQAGNMLESNFDKQFYSILNQMQSELIANNFPTDNVNVIKAEYEKAKSDKRKQLFAKML